MRIGQGVQSWGRRKAQRAEINKVATAKNVSGRVCFAECSLTCRTCGSTRCQCMCTPECPEAARALSSEPDRYPVEPGILPLVFELKKSELFQPCWSCEGHLRADGSLWKLPSVWFYCESFPALRLLDNCLKKLEINGKVAVRWQVAISFSDPDNPETTFAIQPALHPGQDVSLQRLQADAYAIATSLNQDLATEAKFLLSHLKETD